MGSRPTRNDKVTRVRKVCLRKILLCVQAIRRQHILEAESDDFLRSFPIRILIVVGIFSVSGTILSPLC